MADLITMYDDITISVEPSGAPAYAGYVDGRFANVAELRAAHPGAHILDIAVFPSDDATCLDVEAGDATIADIFGWFKRQQARGVWRPVIYSSVVNMDHIVATMAANGFHRDSFRLWSAHYGAGQHICSGSTCKLTGAQCDGTQFTDSALSRSLDESVLLPGFFGGPPPAPKPAPKPAPAPAPAPTPPADLEDPVQLDTNTPSHPLLLPFGSKTMDLLAAAPEATPLVVTVSFYGMGGEAKQFTCSRGAGDVSVEVPAGNKQAFIDVVSGGGLPLSVRANQ